MEEKLLTITQAAELLGINDLSRIESKSVDLVNPPLPLITDIL